ncbi:sensor histidine kinase [Streptomyces sp. NPDC088254]|uniref:sensor histidine kinase n=1 Tax=Streptomyces sp. NPDC088254 TaxID=3365847 RepID=UPI00380621FB
MLRAGPLWGRRAGLITPVLLGLLDALLVHGSDIGFGLYTGLVAAAVLVLRRRLPVLVFLVTLPGLYLGYVWFAPLIALYTVAALRKEHWLLAAAGVLFATAHFLPYPFVGLTDEPRETALAAIDTCGAVAIPLALGLLIRTRRKLITNLTALHRSQASERRLLADQVLAAERARLAREMHDVVAHQVGLISMQAGALQLTTEDPKAQEDARTIRELSARTLDELRHMVGVLRENGAGTVDGPHRPRLAEVAEMIGRSGLDVAYRNDVPDGFRLPDAVERAAYRTVQEALTNVRRYAPTAHVHVLLTLDGHGDSLRVEVRNGPPLSEEAPERGTGSGYGLVGLKERAHTVGGTLVAHPTGDRGFLVSASLPLG